MSNCLLGFDTVQSFVSHALSMPTLLSLNFGGNEVEDSKIESILELCNQGFCKFDPADRVKPKELLVQVDQHSGEAKLHKKGHSRTFDSRKITVMEVVNTQTYKELGRLEQRFDHRDKYGNGKVENLPLISQTKFLLNRYQSKEWRLVDRCFISEKWRYVVVFFDSSLDLDEQSSF